MAIARAAASQGARTSSSSINGPGAPPLWPTRRGDLVGHASLDWIFMRGALSGAFLNDDA
jgi:hypothetical protein